MFHENYDSNQSKSKFYLNNQVSKSQNNGINDEFTDFDGEFLPSIRGLFVFY
jgi:hypothetical protein